MSYRIKAADLSALQLNVTDEVQSVLQNVAVILSTPKGSIPLHRDFGIDMTTVDRPLIAAKPLLYASIKEAIEEYEERATVKGITFEADPDAQGKLIATVEVIINES